MRFFSVRLILEPEIYIMHYLFFSKTFKLQVLLLSICSLLFIACGEENASKESEEKCAFGSPTPIFKTEIEGIKNFKFEKRGNSSFETAYVDSVGTFEITQSGCDELIQSWFFNTKDTTSNWAVLKPILNRNFSLLAQLDSKYFVLGQYANTVLSIESLKKGAPLNLDPNTQISWNSFSNANDSIKWELRFKIQ